MEQKDYDLIEMLDDLKKISEKAGDVNHNKNKVTGLINQLPEGASKEFFKQSMKDVNSGNLDIHNMHIFAENVKKYTNGS